MNKFKKSFIKFVEFILIDPTNFIFKKIRSIYLYFRIGIQWIEPPKNYNFSIGEKVRLNPFERKQKLKNSIGIVKYLEYNRMYGLYFIQVMFDGHTRRYFSENLLIDRNYLKRKEKLKIKYKKIDPFEEEIWAE